MTFLFVMTGAGGMAANTQFCLTGCFSSNNPKRKEILEFKRDYGKKPAIVMFFVDWDHLIDPQSLKDIKAMNCVPMVTWEPWNMNTKVPVDYDAVLSGKYDSYIRKFISQIRGYKKTLFLRFAHEMNGNWYPWSGVKIGSQKYIKLYQYLYHFFKREKCLNVKWVLCFSESSVPQENNGFSIYYPGDEYVDVIGIDGYNWGNTQSWSNWASLYDIFWPSYDELYNKYKKPMMICEFSSTSQGGDKVSWIREGMQSLKQMPGIKGFVLFNIIKETDWKFSCENGCAKAFKNMLASDYFEQDFERIASALLE